MNASRAFTLKYDTLLSIGRVQTPTLAILVKRRKEIENFKPEGFCTLTADFGDYKGVYFSDQLDPDTHLKQKADAEKIAAEIRGKTGTVRQAETVRKHELPPQLYDLTSLQRDANRMLGFTADKTLKTAQSLYEKHKALTYPRTDSRYLPPDMIPRVVQTMKLLPESYRKYIDGALPGGKLPVTRRTIDETKVTDHHAIIPTARKADPSKFDEDERKLFDLVARRMLAAFYPTCDYDATRIITQVGDHCFRTTGKVIVNNGWHDVPPLENPPKPKKKTKPDDDSENPLPPLKEGDERPVKASAIKEDVTKPPSPHTDASLLAAMETAGKELDDEELVRQMKGSGIGTPATRAAIIERLLHVGYAQRRGKTLQATDKGVTLIDVVPGELSSPELTGRWELALHDITDGKQDPERFMEGIARMSRFLVDYARESTAAVAFPQEQRQKGKGRTKISVKALPGAVCPLCGKGGLQESPRAFSCTENGCPCTIWKDCLVNGGGPELTDKLMLLLLEKKELQGSTGLLMIREGRILFYPKGSEVPSVNRPMIWEKKASAGQAGSR
jgi:DNA topoisomerase-3